MRLANEQELAKLFPECEMGAMPPFGELYGIAPYADPCFRERPLFALAFGSPVALRKLSPRHPLRRQIGEIQKAARRAASSEPECCSSRTTCRRATRSRSCCAARGRCATTNGRHCRAGS